MPISDKEYEELCAGVGEALGETCRELRAEFEAKLAAFETRPTLKYSGVWDAEREYREGEFVTRSGSMFHANTTTRAEPGKSSDWQLAVKRGRGAKGVGDD